MAKQSPLAPGGNPFGGTNIYTALESKATYESYGLKQLLRMMPDEMYFQFGAPIGARRHPDNLSRLVSQKTHEMNVE